MAHWFLRVVIALCVGIYLLNEVQTPWQLGLIIVGVIARDALQNWWRNIRSADRPDTKWLYEHAKLWGIGAHESWHPNECQDCRIERLKTS